MNFFLILFILIWPSCSSFKEKIPIYPEVDSDIILYPDLPSSTFTPPGEYCYLLQDLETGHLVEAKDERGLFSPASSLKVLTAVYALSLLGDDFKFETKLFIDGSINKGTLKGNVYLKGGGDPLLFTNHLMQMVEGLKRLGIERVIGGFFYDNTLIYSSPHIDIKQNSSLPYNPAVGPLSVEFNRSRLIWERDDQGRLRYFSLPLPYFNKLESSDHPIEFENELIYDKSNSWKFSKGNKVKGDVEIPIKNPAIHAALLFHYLAKIRGIQLPFPKFQQTPAILKLKLVYSHQSFPLYEIVALMMEYSNNLIAEMILLMATKKEKGKIFSIADSANIMKNWAIKKMQLEKEGIKIVNGSGLSSENKISCLNMGKILSFASKMNNKRAFYTDLPISGVRGTLGSRLLHPDLSLKVWAKTGTMNYASSLVGYLFQKNKMKVFSILINDEKKRKVIDENPMKRSRENSEALPWRKSAQMAQDALLQKWLTETGSMPAP